MNICIFGDSITEGYYDYEKGGWVNRLKEKFTNNNIYNFGISGDTTDDLLDRFSSDIKDKNPELIIFAIGINDSEFFPKENKNLIEFDKFKNNIKELIKKSREFTNGIVFVGLVSVEEEKVSPIPWGSGDWHYLNKEIERYDDAIKQICEVESVKFIDINEEMKVLDYKKILKDGIHPNSDGHRWMADKILEQLNLI